MVSYDGFSVCPRKITETNIALFTYKKRFCFIWKSKGINFNKAIDELKINLKLVEKITSETHVRSSIIMNINLRKFNLN